jgi:hypothetical protein
MLANSVVPISVFHGDLTDPSVLRLVFAIPFILAWLGVGHWVTVTAVGRVSNKFEIAVLTGATAIAVVILQGLVLNAVGCLSTSGWVVSTALIGLLVFAQVRSSDVGVSWPRLPRIDRRQAGAFAASILLVVVAVIVARAGVDQHRQFKFTEFWLLPAGTNQQFILGVANREQKVSRIPLRSRPTIAWSKLGRTSILRTGKLGPRRGRILLPGMRS